VGWTTAEVSHRHAATHGFYRNPVPHVVLDARPVHGWRGNVASADPDMTRRRI
jgi:hypothetical protein